MNIPNTITLIRVILIPFFVDLMIYGYHGPALFVFIIACLTDALDGMVARLTNTRTELGAFLDPVADKLLIVTSFVTLAILDRIPVWLVIIVVSRDIILALGSLVIYITGHKLTVRPSLVGKATTVLQFSVVTVTLVLIAYNVSHGYLDGLYWATAAATVVSGVHYVMQGMKIMG
jgi:cardiolipin synthase